MRWIASLALLLSGCASLPPSTQGETRLVNTTPQVAKKVGDTWQIKAPPAVRFTGKTATSQEIRQWAAGNGLKIAFTLPDGTYAQMESQSAIQGILWLKRFNKDTGQVYINSQRDCEDFASKAQLYPVMFGQRFEHAPAVWVIYAHMNTPFAGVSDGYHALNVAWTDKGIFVFEPQGINLIYQDLLSWPNVRGITHGAGN